MAGEPQARMWSKNEGPYTGAIGIPWRRAKWERPCPVITGAIRQFHPGENRVFTVGETAALCGYPNDYRFTPTSPSRVYAEIGKGILTPMGEYLAKIAYLSLNRDRPVRGGRFRIVDWRPKVNEIMHTFPSNPQPDRERLLGIRPEWLRKRGTPIEWKVPQPDFASRYEDIDD